MGSPKAFMLLGYKAHVADFYEISYIKPQFSAALFLHSLYFYIEL